MDVVFDLFEVPIPQTAPEQRRSKRKREITGLIEINTKKKKIWTPYGARLTRRCYGDIPHDVPAWNLPDTINRDLLDERVKRL